MNPQAATGIEPIMPARFSAMRRSLRHVLALAALVCLAAPAHAEPLDTALLDRVLAGYTRPVSDAAGVRVNYQALAKSADWR